MPLVLSEVWSFFVDYFGGNAYQGFKGDEMGTLNIRDVPDDLHREAKATAAKEGRSLRDWFIEAIKEKLERSEKK